MIQKDTKKRVGYALVSLVVIVIAWEFIALTIVQNKFILPSCTDVVAAFISLLGQGLLYLDLRTSLLHFGIGIALSLLIGVPIGICMGWFTHVRLFLDPIIEIVRPIPPLAWIPFAIIWFGLTDFSAGFVVFIGSVFPIIINTYAGFSTVPKVFVDAGKVLGCTSSLRQIRYIAFPAAMPHVVSGFRVACGIAWMCLVAAEMFGVSRFGLGQKIWWYYNLHQMDKVLVYILILGFIGLTLDTLFRWYIDKTLLKWKIAELS
ncbi:MAG: ABC transporter permease [Methanomicrobiales archaeon]|nr:ABC transporter permease [Methanomicrobiales archaeon]